MAASNRGDIDEDDGRASPRFRLDATQLNPPSPHIFDLPEISDIKRLELCLDREEMSISDFGQRLASFRGLSQYVIAIANHTASLSRKTVHQESDVRPESVIREPTHAAAFLGLRGLRRVLNPLTLESPVDA